MVTICAFALAFIAIAVIGYCEFDNYGAASAGRKNPVLTVQQTPTGEYQVPRQQASGFIAKCGLIAQFAHAVFFMSAERKQEEVRRNELTAHELINEYKAFIVLPPAERTERFLRWRDDIEYFETHKREAFSMKSETIEFKLD